MLPQPHRWRTLALVLFPGFLLTCSTGMEFDQVITSPIEKKDFKDIVTVSGTLEAVNTRSYACPGIQSDVTIQYLIPEGTMVQKGDTLCIMEAREVASEYLQAVNELEKSKAEYNKSVADLELQFLMLEAQVKTIEASTRITELDSAQMEFTSTSSREIIGLEMKKAAIERDITLKKLEFLKQINQSELQKMKLKISQFESRVDQAKSTLDKLTLISDIEGIVLYENHWVTDKKIREGDIVWWIMPIVQIPDLSEMQVKLQVYEAEYKRIENNQDFELTVDAFPEIRLSGKIKFKAPVGKPVSDQSQVKMFEVVASLDSAMLEIQPGLGVTCSITVRNIPDTLVIPAISLFTEDSLKVVYVAGNEMFTRQVVSVSNYNNKEAVIEKGLEGHEILALVKPPESLVFH